MCCNAALILAIPKSSLQKSLGVFDSNNAPIPKEMWRNLARNASYSSQNLIFAGQPSSIPALPSISSILGSAQDAISCEKNRTLEHPSAIDYLTWVFCHNGYSSSFLMHEQIEARIQRSLEKTRKKTYKNKKNEDVEGAILTKEQEFLRKKVTNLMKKQKVHQVRNIVKGQDDSKLWGQDAQAKVGSHLIELLMETAYVQPPVSRSVDGPPDIRPAVRYSLRTVTKEQQPWMHYVVQNGGLRKGCFVDRIWSSEGKITDLVDRDDISLPEKPDTEDEAEIRKWKWKVESVKKENSERHSQQCDVEIKLAISLPEKPDTEDEAEIRKWKWKVESVKKENSERHSQQCDVEIKLAPIRKYYQLFLLIVDINGMEADRKLVKQTVMTSVYSVTYVVAHEQIKRNLKGQSLIADDTELFGALCYAAKTTLTALGEMFQAACSIMSWLGTVQRLSLQRSIPLKLLFKFDLTTGN
ncbi:hypothetical protein COCNU_01G006090 [Cocos nucifera]|uniref:DNA-directed RNA polymerase n=1 Tax=Cocos nucifera TaxID=13894 RepID=A0A8K0HV22_COCNU|nr:hypothetical protein COCNU_01G006090 [Cocos nucifera]